MSSPHNGPRRLLRRTSKFTRKLEGGSLGGEACALSETIDRVALSRECNTHFAYLYPGMVPMGDCGSFVTQLRYAKTGTTKLRARHFLGIQQDLDNGELGNVYWLPERKIQQAAPPSPHPLG